MIKIVDVVSMSGVHIETIPSTMQPVTDLSGDKIDKIKWELETKAIQHEHIWNVRVVYVMDVFLLLNVIQQIKSPEKSGGYRIIKKKKWWRGWRMARQREKARVIYKMKCIVRIQQRRDME